VAAVAALDRLAPPDFRVDVVASHGDQLTMQIEYGVRSNPASVLYVEGRGTFEIVRVEPRPDRRVVLVLRAWPSDR
jgi:hypothetical protein